MSDHEHGQGCPDVDKMIVDIEEVIVSKLKDGLTIGEVLDIAGAVSTAVGCVISQFRTDDLAEFDRFAEGVKRAWAANITPIDLPINDFIESTVIDPFLENQVVPMLHLARKSLTG